MEMAADYSSLTIFGDNKSSLFDTAIRAPSFLLSMGTLGVIVLVFASIYPSSSLLKIELRGLRRLSGDLDCFQEYRSSELFVIIF